jgi:UDP:flavonoid glycosyltransferase YjiC (YdhE family)
MLLGVLAACQRVGQPYVSLEHLFDGYLRGSWARGPIGMVGRLKGLRPAALWSGAELCLAATSPTLDPGSRRSPEGTSWTGPVLDLPAPHDLAAHEPAVLVSLSTFRYAGMAEVLQRLVDATAGLGRVVVTTGPVIDPAELRTAANHEVHRFVPHDEVMPRVSLVVGHGGHATTMRALAHDLPLVVVPMHPMLDQPMVGRAVARAGAGAVLPKKSGVDALREAITRHLEDGPHRPAAARLGAEIRSLDGTRRAADAVLAVVGDGASRVG